MIQDKYLRYLISLVIIFAAFVQCKKTIKQGSEVRIKEVIDGDTIILENGRHVRLLGIDTPEMHYESPESPEPYAIAAKNFTDSLASNKKCLLEFDTVGDTVDSYGRLLAFVFLLPDSTFLNAKIVERGYSEVFDEYPFKEEYEGLFYRLEEEARDKARGMWEN